MTFKGALLTTTVLAVAMTASPAFASNKKPDGSAELEERVRQLEQQLQDMQIQMGSQIKEIQNKQNAVQVEFENARPVFRTGDNRFEMAVRGRFHFDAGTFFQDGGLPAAIPAAERDLQGGAVFRRSQFGVEGRAFRDWEYEFRYEFGGSGTEGNGQINIMRVGYTGIPNTRIWAGAIQPYLTLDDSTSSNDVTFLERSAIANTVIGTGLGGGSDSRRGVAVMYNASSLFGDGDALLLSAAWTGSQIGDAVARDQVTHLNGRWAYRVFNWTGERPDFDNANVQIGMSAGVLTNPAGSAVGTVQLRDRPELRVDGQRLVDTGAIPGSKEGTSFWGFEAGANWKNFYLQGEWYDIDVVRDTGPGVPAASRPTTDASLGGWYIQGSWIVTGETKRWDARSASFGAPRPAQPFVLGATTGAIELAARYSVLDLNDQEFSIIGPAVAPFAVNSNANQVRGGEQTITTLGVNWYLNRNVRFMANYQFVEIDRLNASTPAAPLSGTDRSQDFDALSLRTQFAF